MASRQSGRTLWDQLVQVGTDLAVRMSSQERAVANARVATTALSRARVERDAVEFYLADREEQRLAETEDTTAAVIPGQRQEHA